MGISVIVLSFNSEETIGATLESVCRVSDDIHVVDSFSTDETLEIARRYGANIVQHVFENYGAQRNWAIDTLALKYDWQLHLDSDERLSGGLVEELNSLKSSFPDNVEGYYIPRLVYFLDHPIRHGGMFPIWHMRLFRNGAGRCESRRYDQHFYVNGATSRLTKPMIDDHRMSLAEWIARHNRWSDAEVDELMSPGNRNRAIEGRMQGNPVEKKRALRGFYYHMPLFVRPFLLFLYRYVFRLGFLDGRAGLIFFVLQTFWFRFLVDAKLFERRLKRGWDENSLNHGKEP
ncbi:MAG: glycosyltransferase family 2 protein [Desulfobacterales bacterium]|nr:glycosyltransferase family 2 protein [Desulfobacterales bacterium]